MKYNSLWRILANVSTVVLFTAIAYDYVFTNELTHTIAILCSVYSGSLAIYSANKELERWRNFHQQGRYGEIYVGLWTILIISLVAGKITSNQEYFISTELVSTYILVLGTFIITRKSRSIYNQRQEKRLDQ